MKGMMDMSLGENILKQRKKLGLSQEQLGFEIDVSRQTISNWECEETAPNPKQLVALSKLFNMSVDALLDNETGEKEILMNKVSNTERLASRYSAISAKFWQPLRAAVTREERGSRTSYPQRRPRFSSFKCFSEVISPALEIYRRNGRCRFFVRFREGEHPR